jgi:hypothetical protein
LGDFTVGSDIIRDGARMRPIIAVAVNPTDNSQLAVTGIEQSRLTKSKVALIECNGRDQNRIRAASIDVNCAVLERVDEIGPFQPVPAEQLFKKSKSAPKPQE